MNVTTLLTILALSVGQIGKAFGQTTVDIVVGTGTSYDDTPFFTSYADVRTNLLYSAEEVTAAGGVAGPILRIGFNVQIASSRTMNGFQIGMQHTDLDQLIEVLESGWTIVYSGTYIVPDTGWQFFDLDSPFEWNGIDNLVVEVCFDNDDYGGSSSVFTTVTLNNTRYRRYADEGNGCALTNADGFGSASPHRANLAMTILVTSAVDPGDADLPRKFELRQNYPNPFNPTCVIEYDLPRSSPVTLAVFDILGREIATLVHQEQEAGEHRVEWSARSVSSGIYFYQLQAGDFRATEKMILVR